MYSPNRFRNRDELVTNIKPEPDISQQLQSASSTDSRNATSGSHSVPPHLSSANSALASPTGNQHHTGVRHTIRPASAAVSHVAAGSAYSEQTFWHSTPTLPPIYQTQNYNLNAPNMYPSYGYQSYWSAGYSNPNASAVSQAFRPYPNHGRPIPPAPHRDTNVASAYPSNDGGAGIRVSSAMPPPPSVAHRQFPASYNVFPPVVDASAACSSSTTTATVAPPAAAAGYSASGQMIQQSLLRTPSVNSIANTTATATATINSTAALNRVPYVMVTASSSLPSSSSSAAAASAYQNHSTTTQSRTPQQTAISIDSITATLNTSPSAWLEEILPSITIDPTVLLNMNANADASHRGVSTPSLSSSLSLSPAGSNEGHHKCLYCRRTFWTASQFAHHVKRSVARIVYRCHLCSPSATEDTAAAAPIQHQQNQETPRTQVVNSGSRSTTTTTTTTTTTGVITATNPCALYLHMSQHHYNEPLASWTLRPSRMVVTPLPPDQNHDEEGLESTELLNDLSRRLTNRLRAGGDVPLQPPPSNEVHEDDGVETCASLLLSPDVAGLGRSQGRHLVPTPAANAREMNAEGLPRSLESGLSHLLFRLAEGSVWNAQIFMADWCPSANDTQTTPLLPPNAARDEVIQRLFSSSTTTTNDGDGQEDNAVVDGSDSGGGVLRCVLCTTFRSDAARALRAHLEEGGAAVKCALCGLSVLTNPRLRCAIMAHLLFHMDLFLVCPHCGFVPPPDLPPPQAEVCLRLHLRFVCFHFNLVRMLACSRCSTHDASSSHCRRRRRHPSGQTAASPLRGLFSSLEGFVRHVFEDHTPRRYGCLRCPSAGSTAAAADTVTKVKDEEDSARRLEQPSTVPLMACEFANEASVVAHLQSVHGFSPANASPLIQVAYACPECSFLTPQMRGLCEHFLNKHCDHVETNTGALGSASAPATAAVASQVCYWQCFYRCFGGCRSLLASRSAFRSHLRTCAHAQATLRRAIGGLLAFGEKRPATDESGRANPLCLCLYCDVSKPDPDENEDPSQDGATTPNTPYEPSTAFPNLHQLHIHEHTTHLAGGGHSDVPNATGYQVRAPSLRSMETTMTQVGCPWCREKLSLTPVGRVAVMSETAHSTQELINHLRAHATANPYVAWHVDRARRYQEKRDDHATCYCQAGWLDSPLALMSHASSLPSDLLHHHHRRLRRDLHHHRLSPAKRLKRCLDASSASSRQEQQTPVSSAPLVNGDATRSTQQSVEETSALLLKPAYLPGGHMPMSAEVYRHLRFGEHIDLDELSSRFDMDLAARSRCDFDTMTTDVFGCPLCGSPQPSRWALSEHAFFQHWLRLCYICCRHVHPQPGESGGGDSAGGGSIWGHVFDCLTTRHRALVQRRRLDMEGEASGTLLQDDPPDLEANPIEEEPVGRFADPPSL